MYTHTDDWGRIAVPYMARAQLCMVNVFATS